MNQINILIVEDKTSAIDRLKRHLHKFGYENVYSCLTSSQAIQLCKLMKFDLAILDINLDGSRKNGVELAEYINEHYAIPIIYITGLSDTKTLQKVRKTEYSEYIVKPFSPQQLFASITLVLMKHPSFLEEQEDENVFYHKDDIWILNKHHYEKLELSSIQFLESEEGIIRIYTSTKNYPFYASLSSFERQTQTSFILRVSRRNLVNIHKVVSFDLKDHQLAIMIDEKKRWLPVGPIYRETIYAHFPKLKTD